MKKYIFIFFFLSSLILTSCKEEKIVTDGEQIGIEIAQFAKDNNVKYVNIEIDSYIYFHVELQISGHFVVVNNTSYYNLENLENFQLINEGETKIIVLRFFRF
jgi:hypothetical protein